MTIDQLIPGASVTVGGRTGEVDRLGSDGVVYIWFGAIRAVDQAHLVEGFPLEAVLGVSAQEAALLPVKVARASEVDARTSTLIDAGFEYPPGSGQTFSLSLYAQSNLTNAFLNRASPGFSYPVKWATKDNLTVIQIQDATELAQFYGTALAVVRGHRDSGTSLKEQIALAQTQEALDAIVDTR